jgi:3-oxoadipate enol-lactonase
MPYARVNGIDLYYESHGKGEPLVLAHGAGGNHLSWWRQVPILAQHYQVITFDHRAFGLSRDAEDGPGRLAFGRDLAALLDHLGIERFHLVAHSMGGRTAAGFLFRSPGRLLSVVFSGTAAGSVNDYVRQRQDEMRDLRGNGGLRKWSLSEHFKRAEPELSFLYLQINRLNPGRDSDFLGRPPPDYRGSTHEMLSKLDVPVLFIVGEHDMITPPDMIESAAAQVEGAEYRMIPGAGHSVYYERPDDFNAIVLEFIRSASPTHGP